MLQVLAAPLASCLHDPVDTSWLPNCNFLLIPLNISVTLQTPAGLTDCQSVSKLYGIDRIEEIVVKKL